MISKQFIKTLITLLGVTGLFYLYGYELSSPPPVHNIKRLDPYKRLYDPLSDQIGVPSLEPDEKHLHRGKSAMVASDVPLCSTMGKQILLQGGNAADAAVTVALCIGSVNSHSSGIGGGGFIVSKNQTDAISINAREMAPGSAYKEMYTQ